MKSIKNEIFSICFYSFILIWFFFYLPHVLFVSAGNLYYIFTIGFFHFDFAEAVIPGLVNVHVSLGRY